jgi:uncharacterized integral membrane protein (TIGR00697 family)
VRTRVQGNFDIIVAAFCCALLISNIGATKLIATGGEFSIGGFAVLPLVFDGGALLFPLTYVLGDVLAEVYGLARASRTIILGFVVSGLASLVFFLVDSAPSAPGYDDGPAWHAVLGVVPRIVVASLIGYLVGQFLNAHVLVSIKERFGEGHLWVRLITSTIAGELADTVLFCLIAWWGIESSTMVNYIFTGYVYKVGIEVVLLPITYRVIAFVRSHEPETAD